MTDGWRVLVVDDDPAVGETISELLESYVSVSDPRPITTRFEQSFDQAAELLAREKFDILVLDIRDESGSTPWNIAGIEVFKKIRERCFIPIIFYTALAYVSEDISNVPFVQTVSKTADNLISELENAVEDIISSRLPRLLQSISDHVSHVERTFMANFVEKNWSDLEKRPEDVAYLLSRRLAASFVDGTESLAQELGVGSTAPGDKIHPTRFYVQPPNSIYKMGDLLAKPGSVEEGVDEMKLYVVLTPSCDLVLRSEEMKAEKVVLARCLPLDSFVEYREWKTTPNNKKKDSLRKLFDSRPKGQEDRYFYFPAAWNMPNRIADLQNLESIPCAELDTYEKIASLDSPFAEALSYRFNRYMGRVGMPDLDIDGILERLET